tara:strand:+ start:1681 stop:2829 length:1149 start_codon:yes stop_codon:yes gene_type:complete
MAYDFNKIVNDKNTIRKKWLKYKDPEVIPMWIADMDFACPEEILEPIKERIAQGIFGYADAPNELSEILKERIKERSNWEIETDWVTWLPGAVVGLNVSCRTVLKPGEMVMIPSPIYAPFTEAPVNMERGFIKTFLQDINGRMELDFDSIKNLVNQETKMFFFCNPQNPGGTVFKEEEIKQLISIALENNLLICSDEIHSDLILDEDKQHIHLASMDKDIAQNSITLLGPCKTFNLPGFPMAAAIIPNKEIRKDFRRYMKGIVAHIDAVALVATKAAYLNGDKWHKDLLSYLRTNREILINGINDIEGLSLKGPEASYLAWIDCRGSNLVSPSDFILEKAKVGVYDSDWFGSKDYIRLNFACPRSRLEEAITRIQKAFSQRN